MYVLQTRQSDGVQTLNVREPKKDLWQLSVSPVKTQGNENYNDMTLSIYFVGAIPYDNSTSHHHNSTDYNLSRPITLQERRG